MKFVENLNRLFTPSSHLNLSTASSMATREGCGGMDEAAGHQRESPGGEGITAGGTWDGVCTRGVWVLRL